MRNDFKLIMIGAMYENGGNTTHRFLDGHPQLFVYPYESQIGTRLVQDNLSSMFPLKYRWPVFDLDATPYADYKMIIDEECKVRSRTPHVSKFRHISFDFSDDERCEIYIDIIKTIGRSRANNIQAFFSATFKAWKDYKLTGAQKVYVGYSPIITVDADKILVELPEAHFLHVVRNPWSAYADTKKRPVPMGIDKYMLGWTLNQQHALYFAKKYPDRFHIVRTEDVMANPRETLGSALEKMGLDKADSLSSPTFNGAALSEVYPWGTIRNASTESNLKTAQELSAEEQAFIRDYCWQYLDAFDYTHIL